MVDLRALTLGFAKHLGIRLDHSEIPYPSLVGDRNGLELEFVDHSVEGYGRTLGFYRTTRQVYECMTISQQAGLFFVEYAFKSSGAAPYSLFHGYSENAALVAFIDSLHSIDEFVGQNNMRFGEMAIRDSDVPAFASYFADHFRQQLQT